MQKSLQVTVTMGNLTVESKSEAEKAISDMHSNTRSNNIITVNISGQRFQLLRNVLSMYTNTRLGKLVSQPFEKSLFDFYDDFHNEYFFQRDPTCFPMILAYYANGQLHLPRYSCIEFLRNEIIYWGIPFSMRNSCIYKCQKELGSVEMLHQISNQNSNKTKCKAESSLLSLNDQILEKWKKIVWNVLENEGSSSAALIFTKVSFLVVIVFITILCLSTLPELNVTLPNGKKQENSNLKHLETACLVWFMCEYLARLLSSPCKLLFLKSFLNAIDLLAIMSSVIKLIVTAVHYHHTANDTTAAYGIKALQILCVFRIFKVARYFAGLQVLGHTILKCGSELVLFFMLIVIDMVFFSSLVYYVEEHEEGTQFTSIVSAFWWASVTLTTVGYGDMYPKSTIGKVLGVLCCVSGILFITLPIPIIANKFFNYYKDSMESKKHEPKQDLAKIYDEDEGSKDAVVSHISENSEYCLKSRQVSDIKKKGYFHQKIYPKISISRNL